MNPAAFADEQVMAGLRKLFILSGFIFLFPPFAFGGVEQISKDEFRALAQSLAPKVNLFQETWRTDPEAEFYGGTVRDYLYWIKGQFQQAKTRPEAEAVIKNLQARPVIDIREFIIGDSDVDIITKSATQLEADRFGVRKIDSQPFDILNPKTELGQNEILQGYIPAEKIRLSQKGIPETALGDGLNEIYQGKLSVVFSTPKNFAKSKYAKEGINHPILLAIRYLRLQAINYYRTHGAEYPDRALLAQGMDPASEKAVRGVVKESLRPGALDSYLDQPRFLSWLNGGIQKSFRSYTNPTAALELMKDFQVSELPPMYPNKIEPINQYVFQKFREPVAIEKNLKLFGANEGSLWAKVEQHFSDGRLFHGTREESAFRSILFQGILPSSGGNGGAGLYGVAKEDQKFSEKWAGSKNLLLSFKVAPEAKIVDITKGEGQRLWEASKKVHGGDYDIFAEMFGIDIVRYPYTPKAYVVKNSAVLTNAEGVYRSVLTLSQIIERAGKIKDPRKLLSILSVNSISLQELNLVWKNSAVTKDSVMSLLNGKTKPKNLTEALLKAEPWVKEPIILDWVANQRDPELALEILRSFSEPTAAQLAFIENVVDKIEPPNIPDDILKFLGEKKINSPRAKEVALDLLEGKFNYWAARNYLNEVSLSAQEVERLYKVFLGAAGKKGNNVDFSFTKPLLNSPNYREKIFNLAWAAFDQNPTGSSRELLEIGKFLAQNFPDRPGVASRIVDLVSKNLTGKELQLSGVLNDLRALPGMKELFLERIKSANSQERNYSIQGLAGQNLKDGEAAILIDHLRYRGHEYRDLEHRFKTGSLPMGPESQRALMRAYLVTDDSNSVGSFTKLVLQSILNAPADLDAVKRTYFDDLLSVNRLQRLGDYAPDPSLINDLQQRHLGKLMELIGFGAVKASPEQINRVLDLLEGKSLKEMPSTHFIVPFLQSIDLADENISTKVQRFLLKIQNKGGIAPEALANIAKKSNLPTSDFLAMLNRKGIAVSVPKGGCDSLYGALASP